MHYALVLWFDKEFKPTCRGECGLVVYADDLVATFQNKDEAERFLEDMRNRFKKFGLELEPEKTRLIEFGRYAEENRKKRGQGKPETFDFLGFTHYCSKSQKGYFRVKRKTAKKKLRMRLTEIDDWIRTNRHLPVRTLIAEINMKLRGHYQYYGITDNSVSLNTYFYQTTRLLFKWLNRRSQKRSYTWEGFKELLKIFPLVQPRIRVSIYG
ncbi:MAG: reverse transcriptase domain-containing protein [Peptococcaceae bacterium]|nr:reverse transcriptase domain-containing protein [Peptococcaceae bacterium]